MQTNQVHIAVLTESRYIEENYPNEYDQNVVDEDNLLLRALEELGYNAVRKSWDDKEVNWELFNYAIFRATWDYFTRFEEFSSWLSETEGKCKFINDINTIRWNLDKHYLAELEEKGVRIPNTLFIEPGTTHSLLYYFQEAGWPKAILKPAISAAARHTYKLDVGSVAEHEEIFKELIAVESMLLQEYQNSITTKGEVSHVLFEGEFSHAVLKQAKSGDFRVQDDFGGTISSYEPNKEEICFAEDILRLSGKKPVYARVDVVWDNKGELCLSELELFEPELWFRMNQKAAAKMAKAVANEIKNISV